MMKLSLSVAALALAATTDAFQPFARLSTRLNYKDYDQVDVAAVSASKNDIESMLSPAELKWYRYGQDGASEDSTVARIKSIESELSYLRESSQKKGKAYVETIFSDPKYLVSKSEMEWMAGEDPVARELKLTAELRELKEKSRQLVSQ